MAYPEKLRERALQAVRNGHSKAEVRKMFGLGENTLKAWENLEKVDRDQLLQLYRENPYSTNKETAITFNCSISGIRGTQKVLDITRKKNTTAYSEYNEQKWEEFIL